MKEMIYSQTTFWLRTTATAQGIRSVGHHRRPAGNSTSEGFVSSNAFFSNLSVTLWLTVPPVLLVVGSFGNVMIMMVMRTMRNSQSSLTSYFTALAVSDLCNLLIASLWHWIQNVFGWPSDFFYHDLLCKIPVFVWYTCSLTSAWFLIAMTYQRVTSVVVPHRVGVLCTARRGRFLIAVIMATACGVNFHFLFTYGTVSEYAVCQPKEQYVHFVNMLLWLDLCLASVIPFFFLIIGNSVLITHVIKSRNLFGKMRGNTACKTTKVSSMMATLVLTSTAFLVLTLPTCIFDIFINRGISLSDSDDVATGQLMLADTVCWLMWISNSAVNFFLYFVSGSRFRDETKRYLGFRSKDSQTSTVVTLKER